MASGVRAAAASVSKDIKPRGCHAKKRWNRIESSSSGRESDDNEVIESSQEFQPHSSSARRMLARFNIKRATPQERKRENKRKSPGSDLDDLEEDPGEAQPKEFGSCPRGRKRMPQLDSVVRIVNPTDKSGVKKRRLKMNETEEEDFLDTQKHLQSLIENDSSGGEEVKENQPRASSSKKLVKTPSTTIEWTESSEESNLDATIIFSDEVNEAPASLAGDYTRITAWEVSEYFGLNLINCAIKGEDSVVVLRPQRKSVQKGQTLEVELPETPDQVGKYLVYLVDKYRVI